MSEDGWRWWGAAGVVAAVLFLIGIALVGGSSDSPEEVFAAYEEDETRKVLAFFLVVLASLAYVVFVAAVRAALDAAGPEARPLARLGFGAGLVTATLLVVGMAPVAALSDGVGNVDAGAADTYYIVEGLTYPVLTIGIGMSSLLALATGVVTLRTGVLPRWFGWASVVAAPIILFALVFVPIFVWLLWVAVTGVVLVLRSGRAPHGGRSLDVGP